MKLRVTARYTVFSRRLTGGTTYSEVNRGPRDIEVLSVDDLLCMVRGIFPVQYDYTTGEDDAVTYNDHRLIAWHISHGWDLPVRIYSETRDLPKLSAAWERWEQEEKEDK